LKYVKWIRILGILLIPAAFLVSLAMRGAEDQKMNLLIGAMAASSILLMMLSGILEKSKLSVRGLECNLSGVENKAEKLLADGCSREYTAAWVLDFIGRTLIALTDNALAGQKLPVLYAGGVMSNSIIKDMIRRTGVDARFAEPKFSSDNAAGCALLTAAAEEGWTFWTT